MISGGDDDVSDGLVADNHNVVLEAFPESILSRFQIVSYRNAATILRNGFPEQFSEILDALKRLTITTDMIRLPGGSKGLIAKHVDDLFKDHWKEARITADLHVRLLDAKKKTVVLRE